MDAMPMPMPMPMPNATENMMKQMRMSFYWGKDATVLFSGWPDHSLGMYILAIFFVFFLAMAAEILSYLPVIKRATTTAAEGMTQAAVYAFRISFLYLVMLSVMSFNLGIFIAAVAGHTLGFFIAKYRSLAMANTEGRESSTSKL